MAMNTDLMTSTALRQFQHHPRDWRNNLYVYPVVSRRSGGLSIGINLNPDTACNFDCIYCQVDRSIVPRVREVDPSRIGEELRAILHVARSGELFADSAFSDVPESMRVVCDIASANRRLALVSENASNESPRSRRNPNWTM